MRFWNNFQMNRKFFFFTPRTQTTWGPLYKCVPRRMKSVLHVSPATPGAPQCMRRDQWCKRAWGVSLDRNRCSTHGHPPPPARHNLTHPHHPFLICSPLLDAKTGKTYGCREYVSRDPSFETSYHRHIHAEKHRYFTYIYIHTHKHKKKHIQKHTQT